MRRMSLICLVAVVSASLAACASNPREPARVDYRSFGNGSSSSSSSSARSPRRASMNCGSGYTVRTNDTLSEIAERCGVSMSDLAGTNGLNAPYTLRVGQTIAMPRPPVHVVQRGENLYRIGLRYGVPFQQLANHNGIRAPYEIEVGQQINLPVGTQVASTTSGGSSRAPTSASNRDTYTPPPAEAGAPRFDWPIRGQVLSSFGRRPNGERNDGINIEAPSGAEVRAAAPGQVVYAGSELAGYGQLVLIRHSGGYVTAYAHNSRLLVREGDQISRGQIIAQAGATGTVDRPQVHFEIRSGVNPVDPMSYLN
ncbi:M23 family metallopeptidase [Maricaulis sp.]|uniref:M23 family metallopeptidase n=1 Tax=Maricaulis sp. TaxID=1486257 RepID=UPI0025D3D4BE|nr:M23 family metallopeptidase [Maricaulis sp.]MDF1769613.1 M23 family metallopeptidase [Maricaulis sp.]